MNKSECCRTSNKVRRVLSRNAFYTRTDWQNSITVIALPPQISSDMRFLEYTRAPLNVRQYKLSDASTATL